MKRTLVLGLIWLAVGLPVESQRTLPTQAQCRADEKDFSTQAERSVSSEKPLTDIDHLAVEELRKRSVEMGVCGLADPDRASNYGTASLFWTSVAEQREFDFLKRHKLVDQLDSEDAKGLR